MISKRFFRGWVGLMLMALTAPAWSIGFPEYQDVQTLKGNPSPGKVESNVNDYRFQDEQLNLSPNDGLVKVLRTDQKILVNDFETLIVPIKQVDRREIRNVLRQVAGIEGGRVEEFKDKKTGESFVQLIAPSYMMPYLRNAIQALDVPWVKEYENGSVDYYLHMLHRDVADVDLIANAGYGGTEGFSTLDVTNNSVHRNDEIFRNEEYARAVKFIDIPLNQVELRVRVYEIASANDLKIGLDYVNWKNGPGRTLFIFAEEGYHASQEARGATSVFDPFIDARASAPGDMHDVVGTTVRDASYRAANYLLTSNFVDFLQTTRKARVINEQTITIASANTGVVSTQDQVLVTVASPTKVADVEPGPVFLGRVNRQSVPDTPDLADGRIFVDRNHDGLYTAGVDTLLADNDWPRTVAVLDSDRRLHYQNAGTVGMDLTMTPYIGLESMELEMDLDIGELNGVAPNGLPIINTRTVSTTVRLLDGQPFVIAGIRQKSFDDSTAKMPWLGSVPGLGWAFGGEQDLRREHEVVITIEPHFITSSQHDMAESERINELDLIMDGKAPQPSPELKVGYSQWLLDK
ncbi:MAG: hypothetical protein ABFD69_09555 [Candidatus Sumerlaeia bacterium]